MTCILVHRHKAASQEGVKNFSPLFYHSKCLNAVTMENDLKVTDDFPSLNMMIKAKNIIMKERTWINRIAQRISFVT